MLWMSSLVLKMGLKHWLSMKSENEVEMDFAYSSHDKSDVWTSQGLIL